jgi:hypothetical protein
MGQAATHRLHVVQLTASAGRIAERSISSALKALSAEGQTISQTPHFMHFSLKALTRPIATHKRSI